jgi:HPt (histidine-containing phosphotransfer) domain-containing protein
MNRSLCSDGASPFLAIAAELAGGDLRVARRLLEMIVETNRTTLVLLRDSVDAKAWDLAANAAHRLAGSARMLECDNLVTLINELEAAARARQDVLVSALLSQVVSAVTEFEISVKLALGVSVQP